MPSAQTSPPTIETDRLTLRVHTVADFAESAAMWADPEVTRYIGGRPFTDEEVWARLLRYAGMWSLLGYGYWVVRERDTGRFVGEVGLADFHRDVSPSFDGAPEVGWALATWAKGKGLATEAVRAALEWSDTQLRAPRTVCIISPANAASVRVAEKCGFHEVARGSYKGGETVLLERRVV